jgi:hypothetical protein
MVCWLHQQKYCTLCRRFRLGRQEDAHEYLRCVLDAMHEAFLKHIRPKPAPELAATTFVHRIFGGKLRSQVGCGWLELCRTTNWTAAIWTMHRRQLLQQQHRSSDRGTAHGPSDRQTQQ